MTETQLLLFFAILVMWVVLALGIYPWLQGRALRRELRMAGYLVLGILLVVSLLTAPSFVLWLEYMSVAIVILIGLLLYNHWALRSLEG